MHDYIHSEKARRVMLELEKLYPEAECSLRWEGEPWRLLVLGMLSAQCTDKRVNEIAPELFERFPTPEAMAYCRLSELEERIRPCGLYRTKAKNLQASMKILAESYNGELPSGMDELTALPGVGRKIANLIRGDVFDLGGIVADTHCIRISARLGFTDANNPDALRTEKALSKIIPLEEQSDFCHRLVLFGRDICDARRPECERCPLISLCCFKADDE